MEYGIVATVKTNNNSLSGQRVDHQGEHSSYVIPDYYMDVRVPKQEYFRQVNF